jgi:hypothetical protein
MLSEGAGQAGAGSLKRPLRRRRLREKLGAKLLELRAIQSFISQNHNVYV